jgi:hypothetical protein
VAPIEGDAGAKLKTLWCSGGLGFSGGPGFSGGLADYGVALN